MLIVKKRINRKVFALLLGCAAIAVIAIIAVVIKPGQISEAQAAVRCQDFLNEVNTGISATGGYTVLGSKKNCMPYTDEAGNIDYYFDVLFRLSKPGNETTEGITANSYYLADHYPRTDYPIWVRNDAAVGGQPTTICFSASMQIQEDGKEYNSFPEDHYYASYTEPGSLPDFKPCYGL